MSGNVVLSAGVRANLLALQQTTDLITTTQTHLATGKKVNSALDNATNFFLASSFQTSVANLNTLLDQINLAQRTLDNANSGITHITDLLNTAKGTLSQALATQATAAVLTGSTNTVPGTSTQLTAQTTLASIGFAATDVITISDGTANTVTFTTAANTTIQSLLNANNTSATNKDRIELAGDGRLILEGAVGTASITITTNSGANGVAPANLRFHAHSNNGTSK